MRRTILALVGGALAAATLAGCSPEPAPAPETTPLPTAATPTPAGRPVTMADAKRCPVTNPRPFVPPPGVQAAELFGSAFSHGNGKLWVGGLFADGVIIAGPDPVGSDGSIRMKFGWYRLTPGRLTITGRRLDAPAPPARGSVPSGYGDTGFQASSVSFPTEGCWEITGSVGPTTLTFVTFVINP